MVSPIRVAGYHSSPGELDLSRRVEDGYQVSYVSPSGEVWGLHYPTVAESEVQRVVLAEDGLSGATATLEETEVESVNRYGSRMAGFKLPAFDVTTGVTVTSDVMPLGRQEAAWRQAWSPFKTGKMTVVARNGANRWTPARLVSMPDVPRELKNGRYLETSVTWKLTAGCWFGATQKHTGAFGLTPTGDLPPVLKLRWDGSGTYVTFPDGRRIDFPALGSERIINLDFGMAGQVTRTDGTVDTNVWSGLQGKVHGMSLTPHELTEWDLGPGMTLEVTPRYLSPWR